MLAASYKVGTQQLWYKTIGIEHFVAIWINQRSNALATHTLSGESARVEQWRISDLPNLVKDSSLTFSAAVKTIISRKIPEKF